MPHGIDLAQNLECSDARLASGKMKARFFGHEVVRRVQAVASSAQASAGPAPEISSRRRGGSPTFRSRQYAPVDTRCAGQTERIDSVSTAILGDFGPRVSFCTDSRWIPYRPHRRSELCDRFVFTMPLSARPGTDLQEAVDPRANHPVHRLLPLYAATDLGNELLLDFSGAVQRFSRCSCQ